MDQWDIAASTDQQYRGERYRLFVGLLHKAFCHGDRLFHSLRDELLKRAAFPLKIQRTIAELKPEAMGDLPREQDFPVSD